MIYDQYKPESSEDSSPSTIEGAVFSIATRRTRLPECLRWACSLRDRKTRLRCGARRTESSKRSPSTRCPSVWRNCFRWRGKRTEILPLKRSFRDSNYAETIRAFFRERLEFYLRDQLGFAYDVVNAVLAAGANDVMDAVARAEAVKGVLDMPEFLAVAAASKRIRNILKQAADKKFSRCSELPRPARVFSRREVAGRVR